MTAKGMSLLQRDSIPFASLLKAPGSAFTVSQGVRLLGGAPPQQRETSATNQGKVDFTGLVYKMGKRSTKAELDALKGRMVRIAKATRPLSVRNLFYQLTADDGSGVTVDKTEAAYKRIVYQKSQLCHARSIPWGYFSDSTRVAYRGGLVCLNSAARFDKWNRAAVR